MKNSYRLRRILTALQNRSICLYPKAIDINAIADAHKISPLTKDCPISRLIAPEIPIITASRVHHNRMLQSVSTFVLKALRE